MAEFLRDFISNEKRDFSFRIGKILASSLSGFVAGVVFASVIWGFVIYFIRIGEAL